MSDEENKALEQRIAKKLQELVGIAKEQYGERPTTDQWIGFLLSLAATSMIMDEALAEQRK